MDLTKLAGTLLNSDSIEGLSGLTGAKEDDITKVLTQALPTLLNGAKDQANGKGSSKGFATALSDHAKDDTSDLTKFLGNVDMKDGSKIIGHLLGSEKEDVVNSVAKKSGVSKSKTNNILSAIAPLLMSLLGQQVEKEDQKGDLLGGLFGSLLDNVDVGDLLTGLLTDKSESSSKGKKKKKTSKKKTGDLFGLLGKLLK